MNNQDLLLLNNQEVSKLIEELHFEVFDAIEETYLLLDKQEAINPLSTLIWYDKSEKKRVIALPGFVGGSIKKPGLKWIASAPKNIENGLPRASALLILNDETTGFPIAILEASKISGIRTVLSAIVALEKLHSGRHIQALGIIGSGYISEQFLLALRKLGWKIDSVHICDQLTYRIREFQEKFPSQHFMEQKNPEKVIKDSQVVFLATTALEPYIFDLKALEQQIILNISLRDLSLEFILRSNNIVDNLEHILSSNTAVFLAYKKNGHQSNFINGNIASLIRSELTLDATKPTIFSPMGLGVLDIVVGNMIYQAALKNKVGFIINNFFKQ